MRKLIFADMAHPKQLLLALLCLISVSAFSQEHETVLSAPENWQEEIIPFPIGFAQEIDLVGIEDLRFAPGWNDSTSQEFWAYTFVWYVEPTKPMSLNKLTEYFNLYYDGLMGIDGKNENRAPDSPALDKTICHFVQTDWGFTGNMRVHDGFFTKEYMILNIKVTDYLCTKTNMQVISCDITPQPFDHEVWGIFDQVNLAVECE
jgi:hypothetical protein